MASPLTLVAERFPHLREQVARLFERDEDFRELCEDLAACEEAAARLHCSIAGREALCCEYSALCLRLQTELLRYLERAGAANDPSSKTGGGQQRT